MHHGGGKLSRQLGSVLRDRGHHQVSQGTSLASEALASEALASWASLLGLLRHLRGIQPLFASHLVQPVLPALEFTIVIHFMPFLMNF